MPKLPDDEKPEVIDPPDPPNPNPTDPPKPPDNPPSSPVPDAPSDIPGWGKKLMSDVDTIIQGLAKPAPPTDDGAPPSDDPTPMPGNGEEIEDAGVTKKPWHKRGLSGKWGKDE